MFFPIVACYARIELREATIYILDGLSGTGAVNEATPSTGASDLDVDTLVLNTTDTDLVPIGARFTIASESGSPIHTVTARTPSTSSPTTNITFTPVTASGVADNAVITFLPQRLEVTVGDGNLTWTVNKEYEYLLDRGNLDTVREGDQIPMDVTLDLVYEQITQGTSEAVTPYDAFNKVGGASEWVSASTDACEPYAVDLQVVHARSCGSTQDETTLFPDYRYDSLTVDLDAATISTAGRCNVVKPTVTRG